MIRRLKWPPSMAASESGGVRHRITAYSRHLQHRREYECSNPTSQTLGTLCEIGRYSMLLFGLSIMTDFFFFNEDRNVVYKMCRTDPISSHEHYVPSGYINRFLDSNLHTTQQEIDEFVSFVSDVIGLPRKVYNVVISCLGAFEAAIKLLEDDINLAYSMMIYCAETLAQNYSYTPSWDDYSQNQRVALEKCFIDISVDKVERIKGILLRNEHLKLSRRFVNFITQYLDDDFILKMLIQ